MPHPYPVTRVPSIRLDRKDDRRLTRPPNVHLQLHLVLIRRVYACGLNTEWSIPKRELREADSLENRGAVLLHDGLHLLLDGVADGFVVVGPHLL